VRLYQDRPRALRTKPVLLDTGYIWPIARSMEGSFLSTWGGYSLAEVHVSY
jgi:hypothetical protein